MRRSSLLGCVSAVIFLAASSEASAMIQIDRGIAGARLGATRATVRAALGKPAKTATGTNDFGPFVRYTYRGGLRVIFQGKRRVSAVFTTGLGDRTASGVGVGSTEAKADALPGVKCETIAGSRSCHTGAFTAGRRVTDFVISGGKVTSVSVGFVLD
jgi:hypothetical protein